MPDRNAQLDQAETEFAEAVAVALTATADEFADALADATELVAARFSVGRIARMWGDRVRPLVRRLLGISETAAQAAAEDTGGALPDGWDDLPGRYDDDRPLPEGMGQYVETTEHLLRAVGDRLAEAARTELAAGVEAGESVEELRARLRAAFDREGAHLGPAREQRIARTEATRAWNTATLAAARAVTGPDRPLVKQWITRHDARVRDAHEDVNGQIRLLAESFTVAGVDMQAPGDPTAPAGLVVNCRCRLAVAPELPASAYESQAGSPSRISDARENGVEAAQSVTAAAHTGAMIALVPSAQDAARLALDAGEPADELHLTLYYLGEGADWTGDARDDLIANVRNQAQAHRLGDGLVHARAFGANHWNADSDSPCWVWAVGDDPDDDGPDLDTAHRAAVEAVHDVTFRRQGPALPAQHTPWQPHVAAAYSASPALLADLTDRLGPVRFDRIRVAFAGEHTDIPLGPEEEETPMEDTDAPALAARAWSTPGDTALAFEDEETGDGRVFRPGSLYWSGTGPWPLQYADEMLMGHQGAELAGSIQHVAREGARITGTGVLYPGRPAGADALMLLEEDAPLGVSVDLDDVSVEFVDRTMDQDDVLLVASLPSASLLRLDDGSWALTATTITEWTASSGGALSRTTAGTQLFTEPDGRVSAAAVHAALGRTGTLTAAAGDRDTDTGAVVHSESSGDLLMRVTRARLRGATLVAMPAYDRARIVLDDPPAEQPAPDEEMAAASGPSEAHMRVVRYVKAAPVPVGAREVARALGMKMDTVRGHLARAAKAGRLVRLAPGLYVGPSSEGPQDDTTASAWDDDDESPAMQELVASAWTAMQDMPPMPAAWFREPTAEELPPGSGGVHYSAGRVWGWVAQAGVPHAGYPGKKITIDRLAREGLDFSHFLRAKFRLDDGSSIKVGAMTMNVGHDGDGAQCDDAVCQFDNSGTVGAIVTVGLNEGGLWFSGAGAPWLSDWDKTVFRTCQPSYHLRARQGGGWELRAVLDVPVPGHSSPLVAAVIERSNLALAASAAGAATFPDVSGQLPDNEPDTIGFDTPELGGQRPDSAPDTVRRALGQAPPTSGDVDTIAASLLTSVPFVDALLAVMDRRQEQRDTAAREEARRLAASVIAPAREELAAGHTTGGDA
ncbi:phage minor head protein [Streptomyces smyrnaeus]|uniref:phage minor head protein n=1 Tax=Streptomyces smyrnaeus TaxID=1387713 RepID=UPI00367EDCB8